jgi:hypothetical protein
MVKIIDKLNAKVAAGETFFSFEYFPPKTDEGVHNLKERQTRMAALGPTFCDITWGAGGSTADVTLDVARSMQQEVRGLGGGRGAPAGAPSALLCQCRFCRLAGVDDRGVSYAPSWHAAVKQSGPQLRRSTLPPLCPLRCCPRRWAWRQ